MPRRIGRRFVELDPHRLIKAVTLDRHFPRSADQPDQIHIGQMHGGVGASVMVYALEHHGALHIVAPEAQGNLGDERGHHWQCVFTCGMLSRKSRATAMFFRSSYPVVAVPTRPISSPSSLWSG